MDIVTFRAMGIFSTLFPASEGTPIQPKAAEGWRGPSGFLPRSSGFGGYPAYFSSRPFSPVPGFFSSGQTFRDDQQRGVFATRAPARPNPIGLAIVRLEGMEGDTRRIRDVDRLDGTPLLDSKPFVPGFDNREQVRVGWPAGNMDKLRTVQDDGRFVPQRRIIEQP